MGTMTEADKPQLCETAPFQIGAMVQLRVTPESPSILAIGTQHEPAGANRVLLLRARARALRQPPSISLASRASREVYGVTTRPTIAAYAVARLQAIA